jgi:uroporphyrin-III C-methyltransferase
MYALRTGPGKVFIVGAGPGSEDLITLRGLRALRQADIVLYDALVNPDLLSEAPAAARKVFVGKRCGQSSMEQREINRRLVSEAAAGRTVVRLKGGDPLVFGRGGEEALACEEAGIAFELVPGVSSALGAASYAGIPLTHRGVASSVAFITARDGSGSEEHQRRLAALASAAETLVIFMGGSRLGALAESLVAAGIPPSASVAVVSNATRNDQRTVLGAVDSIAAKVARARLTAPMLIIVGEVTNLSPALNWFENGAADREAHLTAALGAFGNE